MVNTGFISGGAPIVSNSDASSLNLRLTKSFNPAGTRNKLSTYSVDIGLTTTTIPDASFLILRSTESLNVAGTRNKINLYNPDTVSTNTFVSANFGDNLVKRSSLLENKVLYTGDPSGVVSSYLSLLDLRTNKNNGVLDQYNLDTKTNLYAGDQVVNIVPRASSLQEGLSKRNRLYYLATTSYQFWS